MSSSSTPGCPKLGSNSKPVPVPDPEDAPYWDGLADGRLVLQRCTNCGDLEQRARWLCSSCGAETFEWAEVSGRGRIYSFTVARRSWVAGFQDDLPYVLVSVALEEQPTLLVTTNLVGDFVIDDLDIDQPVVATYESRGDAVLLQFALDGVGGV